MKQGDKIKQQEIMNYKDAEYKILTNLYYSMGTDRMSWGVFEALLVPGLKNIIEDLLVTIVSKSGNKSDLNNIFDSEVQNITINIIYKFRNAKLFGPWVGLKQFKEVV